MRLRPRALFVVSWLVVAVIPGEAIPAQVTGLYRLDHWTTDQGLPTHTVQDIAQTRDGHLWLTTTGGLVRFDGRNFRMVASGSLPNNRTLGLDVVGDTLLVSLDGGGVYAVSGDSATVLGAGRYGWDLARDRSGITWIVHDSIAYLDSAGVRRVIRDPTPLLNTFGGPGGRERLWRDGRGDVWLQAMTPQAAKLRADARLEWLPNASKVLIVDTHRGEVLFARRAGAKTEVVTERGEVRAAIPYDATSSPRVLDRFGQLWVTRPDRIDAYAGLRGTHVASVRLPGVENITVFFEDRDGSIWIGTPEQGLYRLQPVPFRVLDRSSGFRESQILELHRGDAGSVFAITRNTGDYRIAGAQVVPLRIRAPAWQDWTVIPATTDRQGTRWLGAHSPPPGLRVVVVGEPADGRAAFGIPMPSTPYPLPLTGFAEDPADPNVMWVSAQWRVGRIARSGTGPYRLTATYETAGLVQDIHVDRRGALWVVGVDSGGFGRLTRIDKGNVSIRTQRDGLPATPLRAIHEDADGTMWIGSYGGGIMRIRGDSIRVVTERDGLYENVVSTILEDDTGNLWIGGNRSIHRVSRADLNAFLDGTQDRVVGVGYGRADGLLNPEGSGGHGARADDGRLWFPTFNGAASVDPARAIALDSIPPTAAIVALRASDDVVDLDAGGTLSAGQRQLEFDFSAISLRNPERARTAYRLDGVDATWTYAAPDGRVTYRGLAPGDYTFRVRAVNSGGVRSTSDATYAFTIAPYIHEQTWFFVFVATLLAGLAYLGYAARVRSLVRREQVMARRVRERTAELAMEKNRTENALRIVTEQSDQLRSLDKAKSRLVANVSHEFRTPLSLVIGPMEDVRDGRAGPIPVEARSRLDRGLANARRLAELVDQLMDAAMLEAGALKLHLASADLVALLRRLAESFSSLAERRGIRFHISTPVGGIPVRFDPDQLDKVFTNLLGNAFKFTRGGGEVTLEAWREGEGADSAAVVRVRDTGIGIGPQHASKIFDRFYQVDDSSSRAYEGAGLGLAITREIVELHGGDIAVESELGRGTTFTVRLPVSTDVVVAGESGALAPRPDARPHVGDYTPPGAEVGDETRKTVLLVEDNAELRAYLREMLGEEYNVLEAGRGDEGLALARSTVPDLILSDIMMPGMDGQTLCETVKADAEIGFVPVILLTAKASLDNKITGLQSGADDYLTKPVDRRELLARIQNIIRSRQRLRERFAEANRELPSVSAPWKTVEPAIDIASQDFLRRLSEVIASELANEDLDADRLAERLGMSRSTLYRQTERLLGSSPMAVVWDRRLDQAALWLSQADANVSEIAYAVGFKSVPHFSTRFRGKYGESPSAYRGRVQVVGNGGR